MASHNGFRKCRRRFRCKIAKRSARDTDPPGNLDASKPRCSSERETAAYLAAPLHFTAGENRDGDTFYRFAEFDRSLSPCET